MGVEQLNTIENVAERQNTRQNRSINTGVMMVFNRNFDSCQTWVLNYYNSRVYQPILNVVSTVYTCILVIKNA